MSLPRYPAYKPSGVEWLGEVPEHWGILPVKRLASLQSGTGITSDSISEDAAYPVFGGNGVRGFSDSFTHEGYYPIIGRQGALCGNINYATGRFWASEHAVVVSPTKHCEVRWLGETLRAMNLNQYSTSAAQPGLSVEMINALMVPCPPQKEQAAIAAFLDRETAKIDALIAEQQRLIELLQEKRQAVISHAVTKGLNPDAPMKDSGVEWLGEVPEHWKVIQLKWLTPVKRGASPRPIDDPIYFDEQGEYAWVRISDVTESSGRLTETTQRLSILGSDLSVKLEPGALFLSIAGSVGKPCISEIKACIHDGFVYFPLLPLSPKYLMLIFETGACFGGLGKLGTQLNLNTDTIGSIYIAVPPEADEIESIIQHCSSQGGGLHRLSESVSSAISLLQERRSALISAAVTGQIDVRGLVPEVEAS
jgi:type I restriction enzyme S subunit